MMKNKLYTIGMIFLYTITTNSCTTLKKIGLIPSELEMATGLKNALEQGLFKGFDEFADPKQNPLMLLNLPGELDKVQNVLNTLGIKTSFAQITQKVTGAMKSSVTVAKPIFIESLRKMTLRDASKILITDNPNAATDYFKQSATPELLKALTPIVDSTIKMDGADKEYKQIADVYNLLPFTNKKMESNLSGFVAGRAIDVMFMMIAKEEQEIRSKYQLRKTDLMRKVFNYAETEIQKQFQKNQP